MCAINGFNFNDKDLILKMNKITSHRGPDGTGVFLDDNISLGHNRLSIIDLSERSSQPMKSFDENFTIVFNGEIYNFQELKKEFQDYPFKTKSDTEVVLAAYKKWGSGCVKKFNGIFAFAVFDKNKNELFLARDRLGVKPLYYYYNSKEQKIIFSSEIKAILEHPIEREILPEAFAHYFRIHYVPHPLTIFKNIFKLPPACILKFDFNDGKVEIKKYWNPSGRQMIKDKKQIKEHILDLLNSSVKMQLISDRPVGVFLSGGIDSSAILNFASKNLSSRVKTFSIGFEIKGHEEKFNADFRLARKTAEFFGSDHREFLISGKDILSNIEKTIFHMDEPISNTTQTTTMLLSKYASSDVAVILGGDGGDEIFGGYDRYRLSRIMGKYQMMPKSARKVINPLISLFNEKNALKLNIEAGSERYLSYMSEKENVLLEVVKPEFLAKGNTKDFFDKNYFSSDKFDDFENDFMLADLDTWLVDESLMRTDKMTMTYGLEERVPFLDHRLVELGFRIPSKFKVSCFDTKIILKEALKPHLPEYLFKQPKRGWFAPMAKWLRTDLKDFAYSVLSEDYCPDTKVFFDFVAIKKILDDHIEKRRYNLNIIWSLITFQIWYKKFMQK